MNKDYKTVVSMRFNKTITTLIILLLANTGCSTVPTVKEAAVLDTVTTAAVLGTKTGYETNPAGFVGATLFKVFILNYVVDWLSPQAQEYFNRAAATLWTAASVNNLAVLTGVGYPVALPFVLGAGYVVYVNTPVLTEENINAN
jgi:hypothetical protein